MQAPAGTRPQRKDLKQSAHTKQWKAKKTQLGNLTLWRMGYGPSYGSSEKNQAVYGAKRKIPYNGKGQQVGHEGDVGVKVGAPRGEDVRDAKHAARGGIGTKLFRDRGRNVFKKAGGTGVLA